jgi:methionyl aminopeptidase
MITQDPKEISILRDGGKILAEVLALVSDAAKPGISAFELDQLAEREIRKRKAVPSFKNYRSRPSDEPYPASLCVSVDDEVVHGIPAKDKILRPGQIVGLDLGVVYKGLYTDSAITVPIGKIDPSALRLIDATTEALHQALNQAKPGNRIGDISSAIEQSAKKSGFSPVRELVGHGVGRSVHEDPEIPCVGKKGTGPLIKEGMVMAIEPMFNMGDWKIMFDEDGWTVRTADGSLSAHMEHTVIASKEGFEIITRI